jgi:hypothetical protein|tara:strand:+ start:669 stop:848 length:180 start_codon:yes stop_codon:yes gene_type:complete
MAYPTDPIYKLIKNPLDGTITAVRKAEGNKIVDIPFNEKNRHYREYLDWAKTNTAEAAD